MSGKLTPFLASLLLAFILAPVAGEEDNGSRVKPETFAGIELRSIGPALMSGRIADIAVHPKDQSTWYVGVGSGGVWKTTNAGTTWDPIFEKEGSYSIGCVTIDPNNPEIVWVGTGENVGGRHVGYGDGVYRSLDGGGSWENMGLALSEHIGVIRIDPRDSNVIYVACQGPLWSPGGDRGLFKSTDGGAAWENILGGGEYTGVNEVVMDPRNPDVLYASTHQRLRNVAALINGGPESGIHKSTDGGKTWRELTQGLPEEDKGKIGLAVSPQNPDVVYATVELAHRKGAFYRSATAGERWEKGADYVSGATGPHYYQEIFASPHKFDRVYQMDMLMHVTEDGGKTFKPVPSENKHVDSHALAFDPDDPDYLLTGNDGGLYESWDLGKNWRFIANLPVTQIYKVAVDYDEPFYNIIGGTQDNGTQYGPSRTDNVHGIRNSDWIIALFADGYQPAIDPADPNNIYCEWQQGNLMRHDRATGELTYIQPQPEKGEERDRFNWDAPILISAHDPARLYYASQRVWRSDDRGDSWRPVSGDLTRGEDRLTLPMMGRVWSFDALWDFPAMSKYGTITSLGESPLLEDLIYAGTDDGLIQVSEDGGASWRAVESLPGVPPRFFVNDIKADLHDPNTVYAVVDRHKMGDFAPYVLKSTNRGGSWTSIVGDLPERHIVWRIVQDHVNPNLLFVGTEFGIFFTLNGGEVWTKLTGGVPSIPFRDLVIQKRENDLVGASFGRGFYILDDYSVLRSVTEESLEQEFELFPVRQAWWYMEHRTLGERPKASQGAAFFTAPNPPFGAVFTYYLRDKLQSRKDARREREKEIEKGGGDTPYPGWDEIRKEELEEDPAILLTVRDSDGNVVRRLTGPVGSGFHRVAWDLRYPSLSAWRPAPEDPWDGPLKGFMATPGTYSVSIAKRVDGVITEFGKSRTFEVAPLRPRGMPGAPQDEVAEFWYEVEDLARRIDGASSAIRDAKKRIGAVKDVLMRSTVPNTELDDQARNIERQLEDLALRLSGNRTRGRMGDPGPISIMQRHEVAKSGVSMSTYGPTPTHRRSLEIAAEEFTELRGQLERILSTELPALERDLEAAGVPWSPGRGVPGD